MDIPISTLVLLLIAPAITNVILLSALVLPRFGKVRRIKVQLPFVSWDIEGE
jgi:hypothetical protein